MADEALTIKGQSLFLFIKSTHLSFHFVFGIMKLPNTRRLDMKTNFENIGGSYSQQGDYLLPNLTLLDENQRQISVWAMRHRRHLKSSHRVLYYNLLTSGKLYNYLADVERQAENLFEQTIKSLAEQEQITEKLKAENMMLWMQKMNNIRNRATEIVNEQVIYK